MENKLDLTSFANAIFQFQDSLDLYHSPLVQKDQRLKKHVRAAAIQAFAFTYELAWKMLKRHLKMTEPDPEAIEQMSFQNLIRTGSERGLLLTEVANWKVYREERGSTSHTYDEEKAIEIFENIPKFLKDAKYLLDQLKERNQK
jgi:nucleotidyltransferase substrate binding protein (TIGR01987 family)